MAVEMANGEPPDVSMLELLFANSFVTPQFLDDEVYSDEFEDFISSCLKSDPDEVCQTLSHLLLPHFHFNIIHCRDPPQKSCWNMSFLHQPVQTQSRLTTASLLSTDFGESFSWVG